MLLAKKVREASEYLARQGVGSLDKALVLEASMGGFSNELSRLRIVPFRRIPHYPEMPAGPRGGVLMCGELDGATVAVQEGRGHLFEGHLPGELALPVRVLAALDVKKVVLVSEGRTLGSPAAPGTVLLITDHLNLSGVTTLRGQRDREAGPLREIPPCPEPLREKARAAARRSGVELLEGVVALLAGPLWPTAAEARALELLGARAACHSLAGEIETAAHLGLEAASCLLLNEGGPWEKKHVDFSRALLQGL